MPRGWLSVRLDVVVRSITAGMSRWGPTMTGMGVMSAASGTSAAAGQVFALLIFGALIAFGAVRVRRKKNKPWAPSPPTLPNPARRQDNPRYATPVLQRRQDKAVPTVSARYQGSRTPGSASAGAATVPVPGQQIGGYRLVEQVGRGGMAMVFRAQDERLGRPVALKILPPELANDEEFRQRFVRESLVSCSLRCGTSPAATCGPR